MTFFGFLRWCVLLVFLGGSAASSAPIENLAERVPLAERLLNEAAAFTADFDHQIELEDWDEQLTQWERVLKNAEYYLANEPYDEVRANKLYAEVGSVLQAAQLRKQAELTKRKPIQQLLAALGAEPGEGDVPETPDVTRQRAVYTKNLVALNERLTLIDLSIARAIEVQDAVSQRRRNEIVREKSTKFPSPLLPDTLYNAITQMPNHLQVLLASPRDWYRSLSDAERQHVLLLPTLIILLCSAVIGFVIRSFLIKRYGRDEQEENPKPSRRVFAAVVETVARGMIPALFLIGLYGWINRPGNELSGVFSDMLDGIFVAGLFFALLSSLTNALFAPDHPQWRLAKVAPDSARYLGYAVQLLLAIDMTDMAIRTATVSLPISVEVQSLYITFFGFVEGALMLLLLRRKWWQGSELNDAQEDSDPHPVWSYVRRLIVMTIFFAMGCLLWGYVILGDFILGSLQASVLLVILLLEVRIVVKEVVSMLVRSRFMRHTLGLRIIVLQRLKFWVGLLLDMALLTFGVFILIQLWGVPREDVIRWGMMLLSGISIGSITFSLTDIAIAVLVFFIVMGLTRLLQRSLLTTVLPQFSPNKSVHHSISAGVGYVGVVVAITLFVAALGINLESVALVAGALSVGIGFGLQNVVSNFVSGLILIVERPIKVGDWVLVGENEGFVQEINFRATELETFNRASVLIPNADMLSSAVTNLTYKDSVARVDVPVRVDLDADADQIRALLLACAEETDEVLSYPEAWVVFRDFGEDSLCFELRCYIGDAVNKLIVASDIRFLILRKFRQQGIKIPFPQRVVHMAHELPRTAG